MPEELLYHQKEMKWTPINISRDRLVCELYKGRQVHARLEPGDGTRYDLIITWLPALYNVFHLEEKTARDGFLVTRVVGGNIVASSLYGWFSHDGVAKLSDGSAWTAKLLDWWLFRLSRELHTEMSE